MGKRVAPTQPAPRISKKQQIHQLNTQIKILKPKVYIINSLDFKAIVQDLTGNGSSSSPISSFSHPPPVDVLPTVVSPDIAHVIQIDDDHDSPDTSLDCSHDLSLDNSIMSFDYSYCSPEELELGLQWQEDCLREQVNEIQLRNLESWLLDFDPPTCITDEPYVHMNTYGYDYNLSTIM